jgi:hypothetical protein
MLNYIIFILLINVNIINAQGNTNVAISNQDNEVKSNSENLWNNVKDFVKSTIGLIVILSSIAVITILFIIIFFCKMKRDIGGKRKISNNEFSGKEDSKSFLNVESSIYSVSSNKIKNSDGNRFIIGIPNIQNGNNINENNLSFMRSESQGFNKNSPSNNNTIKSNFTSNSRCNNTMNSNFSSSRNNTINSNYSTNRNNTMNSKYSTSRNNTMNSNYSTNRNNTMNSNYSSSSNRNNNNNRSPNSINIFNYENLSKNLINKGSYDDNGNNIGNVSFERLIKGKPQPINVFDRENNPNRTSSLIGDDDIDRLNDNLNNNDNDKNNLNNENDSLIQSYYQDNNIKNDITMESIPIEYRSLQTYRVIHNFMPHRYDELHVVKDDLLKLIKSYEDGWSFCFNIKTKSKGFIPKNKLRIVDETAITNNIKSDNNINGNSDEKINNSIKKNNININEKENEINLDSVQNKRIDTDNENDDVKLIPNFPKGQLILKINGNEKDVEHKIVIEDNMFSHNNSCHAILDYTDSSISLSSTPNLKSPNVASLEHLNPNDALLRKNFIPAKSKLSMDLEGLNDDNNDNDKDNIDNDHDIENKSIDSSMSTSQPSVQNLSLGRQLLSSQALRSPAMNYQRKRSSSQPMLPSDLEDNEKPKNKNRPRSRSLGGGDFNTSNDYMSESFDSLGIDTSVYSSINNNENYGNKNLYLDDNNNIFPKSNYGFHSEPRKNKTEKEDYPNNLNPSYRTEPRFKNKDNDYKEFTSQSLPHKNNRDPRYDPRYDPRNDPRNNFRERDYDYKDFNPRDDLRYNSRSQSNVNSNYRGERERNPPAINTSFRSNPRTPTGNTSFRSNPRTPTGNTSFRSNPRTPTGNTSFRSNPRTPTGNTSFRSNPRTPTGNTSFRSSPITPTGNTSFRGDLRSPTANISFRNNGRNTTANYRDEPRSTNPGMNYMGDIKVKEGMRDGIRPPNTSLNYLNEQKGQGYINQF